MLPPLPWIMRSGGAGAVDFGVHFEAVDVVELAGGGVVAVGDGRGRSGRWSGGGQRAFSWVGKSVDPRRGWAAWRKAIWSLRLRLHSGLRQSGTPAARIPYLGLRPRLVYAGPLALGPARTAGVEPRWR